MIAPKPPKDHGQKRSGYNTDGETRDARLVAEQIEAEYDIQADASTKPLVNDSASSSDNEESPRP